MEKECNRSDFCQGMEDENRLFLLEEWDTQENLMSHPEVSFRMPKGLRTLRFVFNDTNLTQNHI